ncbi:hypothetical protein F2P81_006907 [Scophthalmus maximus]|uniref:Uncharacterized protein n=1 Tax=Scophthalmus maximus TaxID=52904 RepID=A0A6A4T830_SCOMX|nr:hypothetical protein F2P81_006907 [Scophthalmus maximus]
MEKEEQHVQCERAGSTVTKQQSKKSAFALRSVNPCSAILRSSQRSERKNPRAGSKKVKKIYVVFFEKKESDAGGARISSEAGISGFSTADSAHLPVSRLRRTAPPPPHGPAPPAALL